MSSWTFDRIVGWALLCVVLALPLALVVAGALRVVRPRMRWRARVSISLALALCTLIAVQVLTLDGVAGVFCLGGSHDTQYAPTYSWRGFMRVAQGMKESEVRELVGIPLDVYPLPHEPGLVGWRWTRSPADTNYRVRVVLFRNGVVTRKHSECYVD